MIWSLKLELFFLEMQKCVQKVVVRKMTAVGIHPKTICYEQEFLENRAFLGKVGGESIVKSGGPECSVLVPLMNLIYMNNLAGQLNCNHLLFVDYVKTRSSLRQEIGRPPGIHLTLLDDDDDEFKIIPICNLV